MHFKKKSRSTSSLHSFGQNNRKTWPVTYILRNERGNVYYWLYAEPDTEIKQIHSRLMVWKKPDCLPLKAAKLNGNLQISSKFLERLNLERETRRINNRSFKEVDLSLQRFKTLKNFHSHNEVLFIWHSVGVSHHIRFLKIQPNARWK